MKSFFVSFNRNWFDAKDLLVYGPSLHWLGAFSKRGSSFEIELSEMQPGTAIHQVPPPASADQIEISQELFSQLKIHQVAAVAAGQIKITPMRTFSTLNLHQPEPDQI